VPATFTWTGNDAATNAGWMDGNNWSGNVAPPADGTAALFFTATATRFNSVNDFPSGTSFASLNLIETSPTNGSGVPVGYSISPKTAVNDIVVSSVTVFDVGTKTDFISIGLKDDGTGNTFLNKDGAGTLSLSGANTYRGGTILVAGTLMVQDGTNIGGGRLTLAGGTFNSGFSPITFGNGTTDPVTIQGTVTFGGAGPITFNSPISLAASPGNFANLIVNNSSITFAGQLSESSSGIGLFKSGPGTLVLMNNNTYSGFTSLLAGTLAVGDDHALGSGLVVLGNGGSYSAGETLQAVGAHTLTNAVQINNNLTFGGADNLTLAGAVTLGGSFTLTVPNPARTVTLMQPVGESGGSRNLFKDGAGTLELDGVNTYTGITRLSAGTLVVGNNSALGVNNGNGLHQLVLLGGTLQAESTAITLDHTLVINGPATVGGAKNVTFTGATVLINSPRITVAVPALTVTLGGRVSDSSPGQNLFKDGPGTLVLGTANAYTGNTFLLAGTLVVGDNAALGPSGTLFLDGGTLTADGNPRQLANPVTFAVDTTFGGLGGTLALSGSTVLVGDRTATLNGSVVFQGPISQNGTSSLTITGAATGTLTLAGSNMFTGGVTLNGHTTSTGGVTLNGPTLFLNSNSGGELGSGPLTLNGGTLLIGSDHTFANPVTLTGNVSFGGASNLTFTGPITVGGTPVVSLPVRDTTLTFSGPVTDAGPLIKAGPGSLVVSGPSPASLNTVVLDGAIAGRNTGQLGSLTAIGGTVSPGGFAVNGTAGPGTLTVNGNLTLTGASTFTAVVNGTGTQFDQLVVGGTVSLGNATLSVILGFPSSPGDTFTIIRNVANGPVVGTFNNLPEGSIVMVNGTPLRISYLGGAGHDVTLTNARLVPELFVIGPDNQVLAQKLDASGNSASGYLATAPGQVKALVAAHDPSNLPEVFVIGLDNQVYALHFDASGNVVGGYGRIAMGQVKTFTVGYDAMNHPEVFAIGMDSQVYAVRTDGSGNGSGGFFLTSPGQVLALAVGHDASNRPELFVIGMDNQVYALKFDASGSLASGYFLTQPGQVKALAVGQLGAAGPELFVIGLDNQVYAQIFDSQGRSSSNYFLGKPGQVQSLTVSNSFLPQVFALGLDNQVLEEQFGADGRATAGFGLVAPGQVKAFSIGNYGSFEEGFAIGLDNQVYAEKLDANGNPLGGYRLTQPGQVKAVSVTR
jgi:autotransporter-associated beta strand protein